MERKNKLLLIAGLCMTFLFMEGVLFAGGLGLNMLLAVVAVLGLAVWYAGRLPRVAIAPALVCLVSSTMLMLYANPLLQAFNMLLLVPALPLTVASILGGRIYSVGTPLAVVDWFHAVVVLPIAGLPQGAGVFASLVKGRNKKTLSMLIGLAIALFLLAIVIPLLIAADNAFAQMMNKIDIIPQNLPRYLFDLIISLGACIYITSQWMRLKNKERDFAPFSASKSFQGVDPLACLVVVGLLSMAYVLYAISQLTYILPLMRGEVPTAFSYAQYAREGFFQLTTVCVINFGVLALVYKGSSAGGRMAGLSLPARFLLGGLCLLTLVLTASAFSKMVLYIDAYGLTQLRVFTAAFMVMLAIWFILWMVKLFAPRLHLYKMLTAVALVAFFALQLINPDALIARYNISLYESGKTQELDVSLLMTLSADSVPYLYPLAVEGDPAIWTDDAQSDDAMLEEGMEQGWTREAWLSSVRERYNKAQPWYTFNFARDRAHRALQD